MLRPPNQLNVILSNLNKFSFFLLFFLKIWEHFSQKSYDLWKKALKLSWRWNAAVVFSLLLKCPTWMCNVHCAVQSERAQSAEDRHLSCCCCRVYIWLVVIFFLRHQTDERSKKRICGENREIDEPAKRYAAFNPSNPFFGVLKRCYLLNMVHQLIEANGSVEFSVNHICPTVRCDFKTTNQVIHACMFFFSCSFECNFVKNA